MEIVQRLTRILGFHNVKELIFPIFGSVGNGEHIHIHSSEWWNGVVCKVWELIVCIKYELMSDILQMFHRAGGGCAA